MTFLFCFRTRTRVSGGWVTAIFLEKLMNEITIQEKKGQKKKSPGTDLDLTTVALSQQNGVGLTNTLFSLSMNNVFITT